MWFALCVTMAFVVSGGVTAPSARAAGPNRLDHGEYLLRNEWLETYLPDGSYVELDMQLDGNLVLYNDHIRGACWASNTVGRGAKAYYGWDGFLYVYNAAGVAVWHSAKSGLNGTYANISPTTGQVWAGNYRVTGYCIP